MSGWEDTLSDTLTELQAGGVATAADLSLTWDGRVGQYVLARPDGTVSLFGRGDLLAYARQQAQFFRFRHWEIA